MSRAVIEGIIDSNIYPNNNREITADRMNDVLKAMLDYIDEVGGGSGGGTYQGNSPSTIAVGGTSAGYVLFGKTFEQIAEDTYAPYIAPAFSSFGVQSQSQTVEVGTSLSGTRVFTWGFTTVGNIQAGSMEILDVSSASSLASGLSIVSPSSAISIVSRTLSNENDTQQWRGRSTNTQSNTFQSTIFTVSAKYYRFYGAVSDGSIPINSTGVRSLPSADFQTSNINTFTLNTGTSHRNFVVCLPPSRTIAEVIDLDALSANITGTYILIGTVSVLDANGTSRLYNKYVLTLGTAYSTNHRHQITTA